MHAADQTSPILDLRTAWQLRASDHRYHHNGDRFAFDFGKAQVTQADRCIHIIYPMQRTDAPHRTSSIEETRDDMLL